MDRKELILWITCAVYCAGAIGLALVYSGCDCRGLTDRLIINFQNGTQYSVCSDTYLADLDKFCRTDVFKNLSRP